MTSPFIPADDDGEVLPQKLSSLMQESASRRTFLRRSIVGATIVVPAGLLAACGGQTTATGSPAATPTSGNKTGALALYPVSDSKAAFTEIMNDENQHVMFLQGALKSTARPKPTFKGLEQADIQSFANLSQTFENVGVGAYLMATPAISSKDNLAAAGSILTIEARHAGFLDVLLQKPISANGAFDKPMSQVDIVSAASPFIANLNGGPNPSAPLKSDGDILNFALLLEFLEAEFYNLNVPKFFK